MTSSYDIEEAILAYNSRYVLSVSLLSCFMLFVSNQFTISQGKSLSNHETNTAQRLIALTTENLASSKSDTLSNCLTILHRHCITKQASLMGYDLAIQ